MKINSSKIMLVGIMLMILGQSFKALGLEWVIFTAGLIVGLFGFFSRWSTN